MTSLKWQNWSLSANMRTGTLTKFCRAIIFIIICFTGTNAYSQCAGVTFGNSYVGTAYQFNTYAQVMAGATISSYLNIQYLVAYATTCPGWTVKVRTNGSFSNGANTIAPQYVSLRFNSVTAGAPSAAAIGVSNTPVPLSTSDVTLINHSNAPFAAPPDYYTQHAFDMIIQGGAQLMAGAGTYSTTLTFSLYNQSGQLVATQNLTASFIVNFSNTCSGAAITSYSTGGYTFSTYAQQMAGGTTSQAVSVQYNPNAAGCIGWSLKVHASGSFINGANSLAPQYVSLRFNSVSSGSPTAAAIGVLSTPVALSTADVTLINSSNAAFTPFTATEHKFDMIIAGGNQLLLANGTYTTNLTFSLYNASNQLVSTASTSVSFQINTVGNSSYTMVLQNGGSQVGLALNDINSYMNGALLNQSKALKITGYSAYQVLVKTIGDFLVSTTTSKTIPVSAIRLQTSSTTPSVPAITYATVGLSSSDQVVITNPMSSYLYQIVEYDLKYFTLGKDVRFSTTAGTYNTSVIFVAIPQ